MKRSEILSRVWKNFENLDKGAVEEEVFDFPTLLSLQKLIRRGALNHLNGVVGIGKEARIYWGITQDNSSVAVKIFNITTARFKKRNIYIVGDVRFKNVKKNIKDLVILWAKKEYKNLITAYSVGVDVPKPIDLERNVLIMEFIGDKGIPAPTLADSEVNRRDYLKVIKSVEQLYKANLVHADLSEFNIFKWGNRLIIFDLGSAVDSSHPLALKFLRRDLENINRFFYKRKVKVYDMDSLLKRILNAL
ncbi:MAG: serine protein kinase RIO [Nitrososphaerales archaeon]